MDASDFLIVARETLRGRTEAHRRATVGRANYALMLTLRDGLIRWGLSAPASANVHQQTQRRIFTSKDSDMKQIGQLLQRARDSRVIADHELLGRSEFSTDVEAQRMIRTAENAIILFDAIAADPQRRQAITAEIKAVQP